LKYAIKQTGSNADKTLGGFMREWSIDGSCTEQGRDHLERLREGSTISNILTSASVRLSDSSFAVSANRTVKIVLREETNPQFDSANKTGALAYQFRLVVTQTFAGSDPLAIPLLPKPKTGKTAS
jgi:hypothetical protein